MILYAGGAVDGLVEWSRALVYCGCFGWGG